MGGSAVPEDMDEIDGRGLGTVRLEHASIITGQPRKLTSSSSSIMPILYLSNTLQLIVVVLVDVECILFAVSFRFFGLKNVLFGSVLKNLL